MYLFRGHTFGSLEGTNAGEDDAFVSKYDAEGALLWTRQIGTYDDDKSLGVSADGLGNVYITGHTFGSLEGVNAGNLDIFVSKFDMNGVLLWTEQIGSSGYDRSYGVSAGRLRKCFF